MAASLIIGGVDVSAYITSLTVSTSPFSKDSGNTDTRTFTNWDGQKITYGPGGAVTEGIKTTISAKLGKVPHKYAETVVSALKSDSISVSYTSPVSRSGTFECASCQTDCNKFADTWNISVALESKAASEGSSGGSL